MKRMIDRRFGRFQLNLELIHDRPDVAKAILNDVIVLAAVRGDDPDTICYTGIHDNFAIVPVGVDIPLYWADVTQSAEKLTVVWKPSFDRPKQRPHPSELSPEEQMTFREGSFAEGELIDHPDDPFPKYPLRKVTK